MHQHTILSAALAAVVLAASPVRAQSSIATTRPRYAAAVVAGASQFDLSGTGTTGFIGARLEADARSWLVTEAALGYLHPKEQSGSRTHYLITEAQLQAQIPGRVVRPYLGGGGGFFSGSNGRGRRGTASGSVGLRVAMSQLLDARGELRVRGIGKSFGGATAEWTLGVGYRF